MLLPKILIVDDDPIIIRSLHELLKTSFQVSWATHGVEGLEQARETLPDLILLDVHMPKMDGYEVCRRLRMESETFGIPVIFLTAKNGPEDLVRGFEAGGTDYLTKPFIFSELLARVNTQMHMQRIKRDLEQRNLELAEANRRLEEALAANNLLLQERTHHASGNQG